MKKTSLGTNALLNGIKQACSVLFPFLSFAYCTRILGDEGIGQYSFSQSIVSYFILIAALGIPNYAIREGARIRDDKKQIRTLIDQIFTINLISMAIGYILLAAAVLIISKFRNYQLLICVLSLQLLLNTIGADWVNTIYEDYYYLTIRYIIFQILAFLCLLVFVRSPSDVVIYTIITMMSNVGGNLINIFYLGKQKLYPHLTRKINFQRHVIPILILFANSVAGVIYLNSDITMLGFYLSESQVGIYTVSSKVYTLVKTLINAVIMVTIPRFSYYIERQETEEYKRKLSDVANVLLIVLVPCVVGMIAEAQKILAVIAGPGYETGADAVRVLGFSLLFAVGACYFSYSILVPNKKEKEFMIATIAAAITNILLNFLFIPLMGITGAAITTLIAEVIVFVMAAFYSRRIMFPTTEKRQLITAVVGGVIVFLVCFGTDRLISNPILCLATEIILSAIAYLTWLAVRKDPIIHTVRSILHLKK